MSIDLSVPSADLGLRLIIESSTDPDVRHQVATDPTAVVIATEAAAMTDDQRREVSAAYVKNFTIHRSTLTSLRHRVRHAGGPNHLTTRALNERLHDLLDCKGAGQCSPYHVCRTADFTSAVQDAIYAHLAQNHLSTDERRLFDAAWRAR